MAPSVHYQMRLGRQLSLERNRGHANDCALPRPPTIRVREAYDPGARIDILGVGGTFGDIRMITGADWKAAQKYAGSEFTEEERQIIIFLASGLSTPNIAKALGTNRSAVWRKIQKIRQRLPAAAAAR
ncbi:MAG TPA: sigma factor-like helix-turn-helix DNA-binding protein [Terriglobales bacterium]|jgi:DNA-binding CsgD family transcriptional regulator|nr:sigma factor-like helix-turn-helix DNA-binding protein [Terriglobales bacterium]